MKHALLIKNVAQMPMIIGTKGLCEKCCQLCRREFSKPVYVAYIEIVQVREEKKSVTRKVLIRIPQAFVC